MVQKRKREKERPRTAHSYTKLKKNNLKNNFHSPNKTAKNHQRWKNFRSESHAMVLRRLIFSSNAQSHALALFLCTKSVSKHSISLANWMSATHTHTPTVNTNSHVFLSLTHCFTFLRCAVCLACYRWGVFLIVLFFFFFAVNKNVEYTLRWSSDAAKNSCELCKCKERDGRVLN